MPEPMPLPEAHRRLALATTAACLLPLLLQLPPTHAAAVLVVGIASTLLSWRRPLPGWLRVVPTLALVGALLAASGFQFGRDTACAVLAAMLALKPTETRNLRDARSLVGFALFAPFATFLLDQGPLSLLLGLVASLLGLITLARLSELDSGLASHPAAPAWRGVLRMLVLALPLMLATFWLFPRLPSPLWGVPERAMTRTGLSDRMSPGDWVDMMVDDTPALRAEFIGPEPAPQQLYWRGPVLWHYDGRTWRGSDMLRHWQARDGQVQTGGDGWQYRIQLEPTERRQVVALDLPSHAPDGLLLNIEQALYSPRSLSSLTRWELRSAPPTRFDLELSAAMRGAALQLPEGFNPRSRALAREWRERHGDDDAAVVQAALAMIRAEFSYTLSTPLMGRHAVDEFLFDEKAGFCEHYSGAFAFLMRAAGIPARVVTGYAGGYRNPFGDYWLVRRSDAHAWVEVWLPQAGWTRIDPTAAVAPERIFDTLADRRPAGGGAGATMAQAFDMGDWLRRGWNDWVLGYDALRQQRLLSPLGVQRLDPVRLGTLFALAAALAIAMMLWLTLRQRTRIDPLLRAWHALDRRYARLGLGRAAHEPAGDWARRVALARPGATGNDALLALAARFARLRYASSEHADAGTAALIKALRRHRP